MKYLFGPVVSRRYGLSLGVDMIEPKSCSFNCRFCQIGETASTTVKPYNHPPVEEIISELGQWINMNGQCDIITLAGSGEPTLHSQFGKVLDFIKEQTPYPSLLLSNGSLFFLKEVREQAIKADIVKLSLHAWDQKSFEQITRADASLKLSAIIDGYRSFRKAYRGRIDLEVFVLPGVNDTPEQMQRIAALAESFSPDSVFLNSAVRPPADSSVKEASAETMKELALLFGEAAIKPPELPEHKKIPYSDEALISLITRHPASVKQLTKQFEISRESLKDKLGWLKKTGKVDLQTLDGELFVCSPCQ